MSLAAAAAAAAFTDRPWGAAQAQQAGDASRTIPSLADIMSATQWRHLKLAYSGKVSNRPLANCELGQIQQSFSAAAELYPTHQGVPLARLIKDESGPPLADLGKAIERKNSADFIKAFGKLTDACNRCHREASVSSSYAFRRPPRAAISYFRPANSEIRVRVGSGSHGGDLTFAVSAERIVHRSTSKMTAVDQPNSSTPSIACRWAEEAPHLHPAIHRHHRRGVVHQARNPEHRHTGRTCTST